MPERPEAALQSTVWALEDPDLHRRAEMLRPDRTFRGGQAHEPAHLRDLCRDPARAELSAGDVVILDNLAADKSPRAEAAIRARGAWMLFLPPYSPDLNPIENAFAKLKAHLRARAIRTIDALWQAIGDICTLYSSTECKNYFKAAG